MITIVMLILGFLILSGFSVDALTDGRKKKIKALTAERDEAVNKVKIAERGLRQIANGVSGNPVVEAQVVLDDIDNIRAIG
jgi:hypothetical protein